MAEIVNLRMVRKAKARVRAEQTAAENRAKFGRTKAEKAKQRLDAEREAGKLDGAKLGDGERSDD
jgi:hypothetical protein